MSYIEISISMTGQEQLLRLASILESLTKITDLREMFLKVIYDIMCLWKKNEIDSDPSIDEKYKQNVIVVKGTESVYVVVYVPEYFERKFSDKEQARLATRAEWEIYRCVKRGYYYGKITEYTEQTRKGVPKVAKNIVEDKWNKTKETYLNMIREGILDIFRTIGV